MCLVEGDISAHLRDWVKIYIDDAVQIANYHSGHFLKFLEIKRPVRRHVAIECERCKVANCHLVGERQINIY